MDNHNRNTTSNEPGVGRSSHPAAGDSITIGGNVGPGAAVGSGSSVQARTIAGRDVILNGGADADIPAEPEAARVRFTELLAELRQLIAKAREQGEIDGTVAEDVIQTLEQTAKMAEKADQPPPKSLIQRKLTYVLDLIDQAAEALDGGVVGILVRAVPVAALLVRLAGHIF